MSIKDREREARGFPWVSIAVMVLVVGAVLYWVGSPAGEHPAAVAQPVVAPAVNVAREPVRVPRVAPPVVAVPVVAGAEASDAAGPAKVVRRAGPIPDEYVYRFFNRADRDAFMREVRDHGGEVLGELPIGNAVRVRVPPGADRKGLLREAPTPVGEERNYYVEPPEDPLLVKRGPEAGYEAMLAGVLDWLGVDTRDADRGYGVTVAVLDTAVGRHPSLQEGRVLRVGGGGIQNDGTLASHGTAVASLVAGHGNGVSGIAPGARIVSIPVMDGSGKGDTFTLAQGILQAVQLHANIINLSLGATGDSGVLRDAIQQAVDSEAVVVAAVGNDGVNAVAYPARYPGVLAVGAVDARGRHLFFSNRGAAVDLMAPGYAVSAAWNQDDVVAFSGTSAATPVVSGALAILLWSDRRLKPAEAVERLLASADDAGAPGHDDEFGAGLVNMRRARELGESGIVDMVALEPAVGPPATPEAGGTTVYVGAQNRGTVELREVVLRAVADGVPQEQVFRLVAPGQTIHFEYDLLPVGTEPRSATLEYEAVVSGRSDRTPADNGRRVVLTVSPKAGGGT
jgi:subtilisin family serine protease